MHEGNKAFLPLTRQGFEAFAMNDFLPLVRQDLAASSPAPRGGHIRS